MATKGDEEDEVWRSSWLEVLVRGSLGLLFEFAFAFYEEVALDCVII
eukprot:CAMPEP_0168808320 /NCGR_PEP_ID=MMETSP0726-20121227/2511_1 /TAXON_ID=265536 /ORGANISM="Amphiprora sp., Strain CCMP467" /LENGTH=46 /DNA_ID= /DNA_START= /DNA_END= /DNA_ORIENTATION=